MAVLLDKHYEYLSEIVMEKLTKETTDGEPDKNKKKIKAVTNAEPTETVQFVQKDNNDKIILLRQITTAITALAIAILIFKV